MTLCKFHPRPARAPVRTHTLPGPGFAAERRGGAEPEGGEVQAERRQGKAHSALQRGPAARGTPTWPARQGLRYPPAQVLERF